MPAMTYGQVKSTTHTIKNNGTKDIDVTTQIIRWTFTFFGPLTQTPSQIQMKLRASAFPVFFEVKLALLLVNKGTLYVLVL